MDDSADSDGRLTISTQGAGMGAEALERVEQRAHRPFSQTRIPDQDGLTFKERRDPGEESQGGPRVPGVDRSIGRVQRPGGDPKSLPRSSDFRTERGHPRHRGLGVLR